MWSYGLHKHIEEEENIPHTQVSSACCRYFHRVGHALDQLVAGYPSDLTSLCCRQLRRARVALRHKHHEKTEGARTGHEAYSFGT